MSDDSRIAMDAEEGERNAALYAEMVGNLVFANVYTWKFSAERLTGEDPTSFNVHVAPYFLAQDGRLELLYEADCRPMTADGEDMAIIKASIIASFDLANGGNANDYSETLLNVFVHSTGVVAVYPYIREAMQSLGNRLGVNNLTMDLFRPNHPLPDGFRWGHADDEGRGDGDPTQPATDSTSDL